MMLVAIFFVAIFLWPMSAGADNEELLKSLRDLSESLQRVVTELEKNGGTEGDSDCANGTFDLSIDLLRYENPSGQKISGNECDAPGESCDLYLEICVSDIGNDDCSARFQTDVFGSGNSHYFGSNIGGQTNPLVVGPTYKKGVYLSIKVFDRGEGAGSDDIVDEFSYNITGISVSMAREVSIESTCKQPKSRMVAWVRPRCRSDSLPDSPGTDCQDLYERGERQEGVYDLTLPNGQQVQALCQFDESAGWTVIQARKDGSEDFGRPWTDYVEGFGDVNTEYWIGLEAIHQLTQSNTRLSILLGDHDDVFKTANYSTFTVGDDTSDFTLQVSGYSGDDSGDSFSEQNGMKFSTKDRDNDNQFYVCAERNNGGWWHNKCESAQLNGFWARRGSVAWGRGIMWPTWKSRGYSLKTVYMRVSHPTN